MQLLAEFGQSVWLDHINRAMIESGQLRDLIGRGLRGLTSNPSIFDKVISSTQDYDKAILTLREADKSTFEIYDELTVADIQGAADAFAPVYESTDRADGYVSLEINPQLADRSEDSIQEALRLQEKVNRKNLMIKVPATEQGFPVIEELTARGMNVNATLIFSVPQYEKTAEAYLRGLSRLAQTQKDLSQVNSVASVFVSRIDTVVDQRLDALIQQESNPLKKKNLISLKGKAAVSNSLQVFKKYQEIFTGDKFKALSAHHARQQRVLWASTSTKNPDYSDIKYVSELIVENTVNTIPEKTLNAFLDHGEVKRGFALHAIADAAVALDHLRTYGIDIDAVCQTLLDNGVAAFSRAFDNLFASIEEKSNILSSKS
jgi:transaldolase